MQQSGTIAYLQIFITAPTLVAYDRLKSMLYPELTHTDKIEAARDGMQRVLGWLPFVNPAVLETVLTDILDLEAYILSNTEEATFEDRFKNEVN